VESVEKVVSDFFKLLVCSSVATPVVEAVVVATVVVL